MTKPPPDFEPLLAFLERLPAIDLPAGRNSIGRGRTDAGLWWAKFGLDTEHELAWRVVQELGYVLNQAGLATVFMPVSPPPYLNGGVEFLSWVIESKNSELTPAHAAEWLESRLPQPVDDEDAWATDDDGEDDGDGGDDGDGDSDSDGDGDNDRATEQRD